MGLASWCVGEALSTLERTQRPQDPRGWGEQRHLCTPECAPCGSSRSQSQAPPAGAAEGTRRRQIPVPCWDRCGVQFQSTLSLDCGAGHSSGFSSYRKGCVPWQGPRCLGRGGLPSLLLAAAACFLPNLCRSWAAFRRVMLGYRGRGQARAWWCLLPETTST